MNTAAHRQSFELTRLAERPRREASRRLTGALRHSAELFHRDRSRMADNQKSKDAAAGLLDERTLDSVAVRKPFFQGRLIGVQGQPSEGLCLISQGQVLLCRKNEEGEDYALFLLGPGELFGAGALLPETCWLVTARAVTDGCLYSLAPANLPRLFELYPAIGVQFLRFMARGVARAYRRHDVAQQLVARERLFRLLCLIGEYHGQRTGGEVLITLNLNQSELGEMVSLARETVARSLAELENDGRIRREGRRRIWVRLPSSDDLAP